ncbi:MAG TPA: polyprenyl synthetase family protein [Spirochaetota bacterium]|nr:polyprenyl synthetase family protein [Spirochaetota bacterium]HPI88719.1 polyprenyl synthetase family protein [Spirochaetota bacterium]HPR48759.1 polyprenyl synthetase family protein [Spirochaetota bacterium]
MNKNNDLKEIFSPLDDLLQQVDKEIKKQLLSGIPVVDESSLHLFTVGGKKVRAALVILTGRILDKTPDGIIPIAAAAEIVHAATLIHDDIIDQSLFRRGEITVSQKWGSKISVLVGDYMYTEALNVSVEDGNPKLFPVVVCGARDMVMGELYQIQYSGLDTITVDHYFRIIELKTARFMAACTKLGALKAGCDDAACENLYYYGLNLGFAFQIIDDILDYKTGQLMTGKDEGNDYLEGKITLPVLYILENSDDQAKNKMRSYLSSPEKTKWPLVRDMVIESGSLDYCIKIAGEYIDRANAIIVEYPDTQSKRILLELSQFFLNRNY